MRKYDGKNKRNIGIIIGIALLIFIIFSFCIFNALRTTKIDYKVASASIIYDKDKNIIELEKEGTLKIKWKEQYYLIYNDKQYQIGTNPIVYNSNDGKISLYGKYYEVNEDATVNILENENIVESAAISKFYKIADRKYLLIDKSIKTEDGLLDTSNYLLVELDKLGNATLNNNNINLKTFSPTTIITSAYTFDIANEILKYGEKEIDLKKIIGTTNEYTPEDLEPDKPTNDQGQGGGTGQGSGGSGTGGTGNGNGSTGSGNNNTNPNINTNPNNQQPGNTEVDNTQKEDDNVSEIINASKKTSVIRVVPSISSISIDYLIYDPKDEYKNVFVEILNTSTNETTISYLSETSYNIKISNLASNTKYRLIFYYTYLDEEKNLKQNTFNDITVTTKAPELSISLTEITNDSISYKILLDNEYTVKSYKIELLKNDKVIDTKTVTDIGTIKEFTGKFNTSSFKFDTNDIITIKLIEIDLNGIKLNPNIYYKLSYQ